MNTHFTITGAIRLLSMAVGLLAFFAVPIAQANNPGGTDGTGPDVSLSIQTRDGNPYTVTLDNGIVNAVIKIATGQIIYLTYNGVQLTNGYYASANGCFYWQGGSGSGKAHVIVKDPAANGGDIAEISIEDTAANSGNNVDSHIHFTMLRGSPGIYVTQILTRDGSAGAGSVGVPSFTGKLTASSDLNWLAQDGADPRSQLMPVDTTVYQGGISDAPMEVAMMMDGTFAGQFECKYNFAGDLGELTTTGWCGTSGKAGIWFLHPSNEYFTNGPMHREILAQMKIVQATFTGVHFGYNPDMNFAAGETWSRVCGPFFIYLNKATGADPQDTMFADAKAQALAEREAWPYTWFDDSNYSQASDRGTVTGKIVIDDTANPNASAANLWVGVARQPASPTAPLPTDFQLWGKDYQYWTKTDGAGNFTIPNVIAGSNYTLFAYGSGAIGQFQSQTLPGATTPVKIDYPVSQFAVNVTGGQTTALGTVTWTPARTGPTVFEIGVPDRNTQEFRHGDDYWHGEVGTPSAPAQFWAPFQLFPFEWPNGLSYTAGQSNWAKDWNHVQPTVFNAATGNYDGNTWTIKFDLPDTPTSGTSAMLYLGIASAKSGPVIVKVNDTILVTGSTVTTTPSPISSAITGFFPYYDDSSVVFRMSSHGIFCDERISFPTSLLHSGSNTITLNMRKGGYFANCVQYDYVRLEMPDYVPPAPSSLTALAGNAAVQLRWPAVPGATSYIVLRSTTSGTGYSQVASGITGPVSGSTPDSVSFTDSTTANGTSYFYVVQSANTVGSSGDSTQATATPFGSAPGAPSAPIGLAATPGDMQVSLNWDASANADYYIIKRSLANDGPYAVISDSVSTNTYTDLGRSNGMTYYYVVAAANASGVSADSASATTRPLPPALAATPTGLSATLNGALVDLTWTAAANATGYTIQRATNAGGPYTTLTAALRQSFYTDTSAAANTTYYYRISASNLAGTVAYSSPVNITMPSDLVWTGNASTSWNTSDINWLENGTATAYADPQGVLFDDTAGANTNVVVSGTITPGTIIFSNSNTYNLTVPGLSGSTNLTKLGTGTLNISGSCDHAGGSLISSGTITLTDASANSGGLGSGTVTLDGGTLKLYSLGGSSTSAGTFSNSIIVNSGFTGSLISFGRGTLASTVTGAGTLNFQTDYIRNDISGDWSGFTGQVNVTPGTHPESSSGLCDFRIQNTNGFGTAKINLAEGVRMYMQVNFSSGGLTNTIGELTGGGTLKGGPTAGRTMTWTVGGADTDSQFDGLITNGTGPTAITKSGGGTWTLAGNCTYTGPTHVDQGILRILGTASGSQSLDIASGAALELSQNGSLSINGTLTNNGTIRCFGSPALSATTTLINNGVIDLINGNWTLPGNLQNNGAIILASDARILDSFLNGGVMTLSVRCYPGHTYVLQTADSLDNPGWSDVSDSSFTPSSEVVHDFIHTSPSGPKRFYRVAIAPLN